MPAGRLVWIFLYLTIAIHTYGVTSASVLIILPFADFSEVDTFVRLAALPKEDAHREQINNHDGANDTHHNPKIDIQ